MPRTADHIAATYQIASDLRRAGRPTWNEKVNISAVWRDDNLTFEQRRDATCEAIRRTNWYRNADPDDFYGIVEIIDNPADTEDADDFNYWWDQVYDLADYARVWINTHG